MENKYRVLVGCPTSDYKSYCLEEYATSVKSLTYDNYDILLVDNSKDDSYSEKIKQLGINTIKAEYSERAIDRIVSSRNILRQSALANNYDYLLSLEQDVIPPKDVIERLLSCNKKIIAGVYFGTKTRQGETKLIPYLGNSYQDKYKLLNPDIIMNNSGLIRVDYCGLGCVLIHKDVLSEVEFKIQQPRKGFDDTLFCQDALKKGFEIFADLSVKCKHLFINRPWKWTESGNIEWIR